MPRYAIAFDLNTKKMRDNGMNNSDIVRVYQVEIPEALRKAGFKLHIQGSVYATQEDSLDAALLLIPRMKKFATNFCKYVKNAHVFRMDESAEVTHRFNNADYDEDDVYIDFEEGEIISN